MSAIAELLQHAARQLATKVPRRVTVRDLSRRTSDVLNQLEAEGTSALITHRGVPRFVIVPIDSDQVSHLILTGAPGLFTDAIAEGELALKQRKVKAPLGQQPALSP
jgi:prevent-host-death family protein